jgi:hypothetical protein
MDAPLCAVNRGMDTENPPIGASRDIQYVNRNLTETDNNTVAQYISVGTDGWCLFYSILKAFGQDSTPDNAFCLAQFMINEFIKKYNENGQLSEDGKTKVRAGAFNDKLFRFDEKGAPVVDSSGNQEYRFGAYLFKRVPIITKAGYYYVRGNVKFEAAIEPEEYFNAILTPKDGNTANGPMTWPDISVFDDIIVENFGPYLVYINSIRMASSNTLANALTYTSESKFATPPDANSQYIVFLNNGSHFNLLKINGVSRDYGKDKQALFDTIFNTCNKKQTPLQVSQAKTPVANKQDVLLKLNDALQSALNEYANAPLDDIQAIGLTRNMLNIAFYNVQEVMEKEESENDRDIFILTIPPSINIGNKTIYEYITDIFTRYKECADSKQSNTDGPVCPSTFTLQDYRNLTVFVYIFYINGYYELINSKKFEERKDVSKYKDILNEFMLLFPYITNKEEGEVPNPLKYWELYIQPTRIGNKEAVQIQSEKPTQQIIAPAPEQDLKQKEKEAIQQLDNAQTAHAQLETAALAARATAVLGEAQGAHALLTGDTAALADRSKELLAQVQGAQTALEKIDPAFATTTVTMLSSQILSDPWWERLFPGEPVPTTPEGVQRARDRVDEQVAAEKKSAIKSQLKNLRDLLDKLIAKTSPHAAMSSSSWWSFSRKSGSKTPENAKKAAEDVKAASDKATDPAVKKQLEELHLYLGELAFQMRKMKESQTQMASRKTASDEDHAAIATLEAKIAALERKLVVPPPAPPPPQVKEVGMPAFSPAVAEKLKEYLYPGQPTPTPPEEKKEAIDPSEAAVVVDVSGVPGWAIGLFTQANFKAIPATCSKSTFLPNGCAAQGVLNHIRELETLKSSNRFASSGPMKRLEELRTQLEAEPDTGKQAAIQKEINENYAHGLVAINIAGQTQYLPVPNPYKAHKYRSRVVSFANPTGLTDLSGENAVMQDMNLKIVGTGIFPQEILADKAVTTALLRAMWACRNDATATSTDCYPLQVLGELREFQAYKGQSDTHARAKKLLDGRSWPLVETMTRALKGAIPHVFLPLIFPPKKKDVSGNDVSGSVLPPSLVRSSAAGPATSATGTTTPPPRGTPATADPKNTGTGNTPQPKPRPRTLLPSTFGGGLSMTDFLIPNTFGFTGVLPVKTN